MVEKNRNSIYNKNIAYNKTQKEEESDFYENKNDRERTKDN